MCLIFSLSDALSGTDAAPHSVWIVFSTINEIRSCTQFISVLYLISVLPLSSRLSSFHSIVLSFCLSINTETVFDDHHCNILEQLETSF